MSLSPVTVMRHHLIYLDSSLRALQSFFCFFISCESVPKTKQPVTAARVAGFC